MNSNAVNSNLMDQLPRRIKVAELVNSRYPNGRRPLSWDERIEGTDVVRTEDGKIIKLISDGGQSPPRKNWVLMLKDGDPERGYHWTVYGMPR